jgi:membrane-bound ClpP family serine protease
MILLEFFNDLTVVSFVLFIIGVILLIIEMLHPGFGLAGVLGIILLIADIFITARTFMQGLIMTAIVAVLILILLLIGARLASKGKLPKSLILKEATVGKPGDLHLKSYMGKTGFAETELRPSGIASIDGTRVDVVTRGEYIGRGEKIAVIEPDGNRVVVNAVK